MQLEDRKEHTEHKVHSGGFRRRDLGRQPPPFQTGAVATSMAYDRARSYMRPFVPCRSVRVPHLKILDPPLKVHTPC